MDIMVYESLLPMTFLTPDLLGRFDVSGPRYTSYPTADRFVSAFDASQYSQALSQRHQGITAKTEPLSLYVHIPFCHSLCYYCACNKIITKQYTHAITYLHWLRREVEITVNFLGKGQALSQLHMGGGTPTFFHDEELTGLMEFLRSQFHFQAGGEYAIEVDPRTVTPQRLAHLHQLGFNRLSFGVQDFDPAVQKAVHRVQSFQAIQVLIESAKHLGFKSINLDLIYGLPLQSLASFARTLAQVLVLRPARIALYAYAHLPERFKPQRRIHDEELPAPHTKVALLTMAMERLIDAGYTYIGMDHFALADDSLTTAKRLGILHRNFQGYTSQADSDVIAIGVSAISKVGATYSQNAKAMAQYVDLLSQDQLPIERGLALSRDDLVRRSIIMAIMCQGQVIYESIELSHLLTFQVVFAQELTALIEFEEKGMVAINHVGFEVTPMGWFFVRAIAMVFDRYLQRDNNRARFSKII